MTLQGPPEALISTRKAFTANLDLWEEYLGLQEKFPALKGLVDLAFSGHWMCQTPAEASRKSIALLRACRAYLIHPNLPICSLLAIHVPYSWNPLLESLPTFSPHT